METLHARDRLRAILKPKEVRTLQISVADIGKIFVRNIDKTAGKLMSNAKFLALPITEIGDWSEIDDFDVNSEIDDFDSNT